MFKIAVNNLVRSIGDDVYLPSPSTAASKNLSPLSLVEREGSYIPLRHCNDYYTTDFVLSDVLVDTNSEFVMQKEEPFCTFNRQSTTKLSGKLEGALKGIFDGGLEKVNELVITANFGPLSISEVNMPSLMNDISTRKINMQHGLIRELAANRWKALCLVTSVVKTTTDVTITASVNDSMEINADDSDDTTEDQPGSEQSISSVGTVVDAITDRIVDGNIKAAHEKKSCRTLHLPAGTVLAYQVMELAVSDTGVARLMVTHGSKGGFHVKDAGGSKSLTKTGAVDSMKGYLLWIVIGMGLTVVAAGFSFNQFQLNSS